MGFFQPFDYWDLLRAGLFTFIALLAVAGLLICGQPLIEKPASAGIIIHHGLVIHQKRIGDVYTIRAGHTVAASGAGNG